MNPPNVNLVQFLKKNKCKVMYRTEKNVMYLWIEYGELTKNKPGAGLEVWGNAQQCFEKINGAVLYTYKNAELASQSGNRTVVYRIAGQK